MQSDKKIALYYRAAQKTIDTLYLDNQMNQLLCYAKQQELDDYVLYADNGFSGIALARPAISLLKADVEAGRVEKIVVTNISRLGRCFIATTQFLHWLNDNGVAVVSLSGDIDADVDFYNSVLAFVKGGAK